MYAGYLITNGIVNFYCTMYKLLQIIIIKFLLQSIRANRNFLET